MDKATLARQIYKTAHLTGTFKLRSGQTSHEYFDKYLFEADPLMLAAIAEGMSKLIPAGTEVLAGLEMGGIPVVTAIAAKSGQPAAFVRKKAKEYGTCKAIEGADVKGKQVCIVEDVVTTGGQIILSAEDLRQAGAQVKEVICVIQRDPAATEKLAAAGLKLIPLFTMEYIKEQANA